MGGLKRKKIENLFGLIVESIAKNDYDIYMYVYQKEYL